MFNVVLASDDAAVVADTAAASASDANNVAEVDVASLPEEVVTIVPYRPQVWLDHVRRGRRKHQKQNVGHNVSIANKPLFISEHVFVFVT